MYLLLTISYLVIYFTYSFFLTSMNLLLNPNFIMTELNTVSDHDLSTFKMTAMTNAMVPLKSVFIYMSEVLRGSLQAATIS